MLFSACVCVCDFLTGCPSLRKKEWVSEWEREWDRKAEQGATCVHLVVDQDANAFNIDFSFYASLQLMQLEFSFVFKLIHRYNIPSLSSCWYIYTCITNIDKYINNNINITRSQYVSFFYLYISNMLNNVGYADLSSVCLSLSVSLAFSLYMLLFLYFFIVYSSCASQAQLHKLQHLEYNTLFLCMFDFVL